MDKTALIIPIKNHLIYIQQLIPQIQELELDIFWLDRGSKDGSQEIIKNWGLGSIIKFDPTLNYGEVLNKAFNQIKAEKFIILKPDVVLPEHNWLKNIEDQFNNEEKNFINVKMTYLDTNAQIYCGIACNEHGLMETLGIGLTPNYHKVEKMHVTSDALIGLRRDVWERAGGFDNNLKENFLYLELLLKAISFVQFKVLEDSVKFYSIDNYQKLQSNDDDINLIYNKYKSYFESQGMFL